MELPRSARPWTACCAQSFHDWELIVWDDRSTDESAQIIAEYKDPRIRYFLSQEETSLGKARGECHSTGDRSVAGLPRSG